MFRLTLTSLWDRRGKLLLSLSAIMLAVAFVVGAQLFTAQLQTQYAAMARGRLPDLVIAADGALDPDRRDARQISYTDADLVRISRLPGVTDVHAPLISHGISFDNKDGTPATGGITSDSAVGWTEFAMSTGSPAFTLLDGAAPGIDEIAIDRATLDASGYRIGEVITITLAGPTQTVTRDFAVVGVADWAAGADGNTWVFFNRAQLRQIVGVDELTQLWVQLEPGADVPAVQQAIGRELPGSTGLTADQVADLQGSTQADAMGFLEPLLLVFAGISVLVACFMIVNTFSILVLQRTRELALLRALGSSGAQLRASVVIEAVVVGVVGSLPGLVAGWGLAAGSSRLLGGAVVPTIVMGPGVIASGLAVGILVTVLASLLPARRASRIAPVVAMRGLAARVQQSRPKLVDPARPVAFARPLAQLARLNVARQPGRTVATAATLTIGMGLVGLLGVLGASAKASIAVTIPDAFGADFVVVGAQSMTADQVDGLRRMPEVERVSVQESAGASIGGEQVTVAAQTAADYGTPVKMTITDGHAAERADELLVVASVAEAQGWEIGDRLEGVLNGVGLSWQLVGTFEYPANMSSAEYLTDPDTLRAAGLDEQVTVAGVHMAEGADLDAARSAVRQQLKQIPGSTLLDSEEFNRVAGGQVDTMMGMVYALIGLSVLIATLGIVNTLTLSVVERTRELGLLRAIGMTRGQIRGMVGLESLLLSVAGGAAGLLGGIGAGVGIVAMNASSMPGLAIPWAASGVVLAIIVALGLVAAVAPANRAARTPVLQALAA